jgi:hypothetical protein
MPLCSAALAIAIAAAVPESQRVDPPLYGFGRFFLAIPHADAFLAAGPAAAGKPDFPIREADSGLPKAFGIILQSGAIFT